MSEHGQVTHINPETLHHNPAFTNVVVVEGAVKMVYIGGQNAVTSAGEIIGKGDIKAQAEQVFKNLEAALAAGGASPEHIIKWTIYVVQGEASHQAFEVFQQWWNNRAPAPAITMAYVVGLANPDFLMELDAIAAVPLG